MAISLSGTLQTLTTGRPGLRNEIFAWLAVLILAVLSWQMINAVATSLYRQYEVLGDPPLYPIPVAGPELGKDSPPTRPPSHLGHVGFFWSERAFHYRCTLMFATEEYQDADLLAADTWQQHPEGVNAWAEYALLMEPIYGFLYRLAGDQARPLVEFLLRLIPLVHVLIFFPLYAAARALGCRRSFAVLGVLFYASCSMGFIRMTGSLLLKEDFALFWLVFFLAAHLWGWRLRSRWLSGGAALLLVILLASWHLSQFLVLVIVFGCTLAWNLPRAEEEAEPGGLPFWLFVPGVYTLAGMAAALTPSLWARGFCLSLPMAALYAWTLSALIAWRGSPRARQGAIRIPVFLGLAAVLAGLVFLNRNYTGDYNHVFGLFLEKLSHGFQRPPDPGQLSFDTRVFWAPPFNTPAWGEIWSKLGFHAAVLVPVLVWCAGMILHPRTESMKRGFVLTVPVFLAAYLMIERLGVVFLVFGAVAVAMFADWLFRRSAPLLGARALPLVVGVMLISPVLNLGGNLEDMIRMTRSYRQGREIRLGASDRALWESWRSMFSWVTTQTPGPGSRLPGPPAAFLGEIGVSPQLLLYAGRPIVLNSQFENSEIRSRYQGFLEALYSSEEKSLWDFALENEADYLFINRNFATMTGTGSLAWQAGVAGELQTDMNVVRMHFQPSSLHLFQPVFDNGHYRVFKVLPQAESSPVAHRWVREFNSWWQPENFRTEGGFLIDPAADRIRLAAFEATLSDLQDRQETILAAVESRWLAGRGGGARRPDLMLLHRQFGQALLASLVPGRQGGGQVGRIENAIHARLSEIDPLSGQPLGASLLSLAMDTGGWLDQLDHHLGEPMQYATGGQLLALAGEYGRAAEQFAAAAAFYDPPGLRAVAQAPVDVQVRLWHEEVWWLMAAGDIDRARELAGRYAAVVRSGSREADFFGMVKAIPTEIE